MDNKSNRIDDAERDDRIVPADSAKGSVEASGKDDSANKAQPKMAREAADASADNETPHTEEEREHFVDNDNAWLEDGFDDGDASKVTKTAEKAEDVEPTDVPTDATGTDDAPAEPAEPAISDQAATDTGDEADAVAKTPEELADETLVEKTVPQRRSTLLNIPSPESEVDATTQTNTTYMRRARPQEPTPFETIDAQAGGVSLQSDMPKVSDHVPMGGADAPRRRRWPLVVGAILAALLLVYAVGALYFSSHFFPNTTVNGEDVSNMTVSELSSYVTNLGATYQTKVSGQGIDFDIEGTQIGFSYDGVTYGNEAGSQISAWTWPVELTKTHEYKVNRGITFDVDKLDELIIEKVSEFNDENEPPTDATATYDAAKKQFVVVPERIGTQLSTKQVQLKCEQSVSGMAENITIEESELRQPKIRKDDTQLVATVDRSNKLLGKKIMIRVADKDAKEITSSQLKDWLVINEDRELDVNRDAIEEWVQNSVADEFNTVGNKRTYKRPDGAEIEVEGGTYGWALDNEGLTDEIEDHLKNDNTDPIDAPMSQTADSWNPDGKEWPDRYIDADLSEQHVRLYDGDEVVWESDCVSGNTTENHGTVLGVFYVQEKVSPMTLVGLDENHDGQPDYESYVTYWMPFDGGYGLHDATWRGAFGGNIYTYNGSHGCVNLPYSAAEQLYNMIDVGTVVITHF